MRSDFEIWDNGVPVVTMNGSPEFDSWYNGAPVSDVGEAVGGTTAVRRRTIEF